MSCEAFEKLIALDAGGDLAPAEAAQLQAHLEACAPCRELARSIGESQAGLKALAGAGLDEDALARWRRGLLARIDAEPRRRILGWRWAWAAAAAMALVALVAVPQLPRRTPSKGPVASPRSPVAQAVPPALASPPPVARAVPSASARPPRPPAAIAHRRPLHPPAPAPVAEPLLVKLETADPNVVIYWFVDRKGN
jgi:hypothetical protein